MRDDAVSRQRESSVRTTTIAGSVVAAGRVSGGEGESLLVG
jgi:hypothetical protein